MINISSKRVFKISEVDIVKLLNYLVKLPYQEVFALIQILQSLKSIEEEQDADNIRS
jgi:predicted transcriptional regulator